MTQDYSDEWRKALTERDMAVRAIAEFLDALGLSNPPTDPDDNGDRKSFEVVELNDIPGGTSTRVRPQQFPEFDQLKEVVAQFKPKALR